MLNLYQTNANVSCLSTNLTVAHHVLAASCRCLEHYDKCGPIREHNVNTLNKAAIKGFLKSISSKEL